MRNIKKLNLIILTVIIILFLTVYYILNSSQNGSDPIAKCFINSEEYILINPDGIDIYTTRDGEKSVFKASDGRKIISGCTDDLNRDGALEILVVLADSVSEYGNELIIFSYNNTLEEVCRVAYKELNPWKVMTGDVDGDGVKEISLGVYKKSDFHPVMARRPFIYNWDGRELSPKWLGSRLSRPFEDFMFSDVDEDNMDEIVAIEILQDGEKVLNSYKWKGFGFEELAESQKYNDISELTPKNYKNDLKTKFSAKIKGGSGKWMEVDFCYRENSLVEMKSKCKGVVLMSARKFLSMTLCFVYFTVMLLTGCGSKKNEKVNTGSTTQTSQTSQTSQSTQSQAKPQEVEGPYGKPLFTRESGNSTSAVLFDPVKYEAKVKPYKVSGNLSNIENLELFSNLTPEQIEFIEKNGFVVTPTKEEQLFYIYENNEYVKVPSFITTDSILQIYHVFYDYSLRTLENEKLYGILKTFNENMLKKSAYIYSKLKNEEVKKAALKNTAYFYVAQVLTGGAIPQDIPGEAKALGDKELKLISSESGFVQSAIFPYQLDYSQFKARGHYTRNEELTKYFKAMMWYGTAPFPLYKNEKKDRNIDQTLQALLITYSLYMKSSGEQDIGLWEKIYNPTVFYVGKTDDLCIYDYRELLVKVYGEDPDIEKLSDSDKLDRLYSEADKLPEPKIKAKYTEVTTPVGKQFRLMGQRYIPDSEIIQELVEPIIRPVPSGLDVMGVLGSERAYDLLINVLKANKDWPKYTEVFKKLKTEFAGIADEVWRSNMYYGWLWVLKPFAKIFGEGYPSFMRNTAWQDKSLNTALGSWGELRHDTILYGKQAGAECGGGEGEPPEKGYVEPNIEVYERLLWLTRYSRANLKEKEIISNSIEDKMQVLDDLLNFLIRCSVKELKNEELTEDEYYQIKNYGAMLEYLTSSFAEDGMKWFEITSETDKNMAIIADIHTIAPNKFSDGGYFEVGVGPASEIYVAVPIGGKLYLTRGAVFSYYEFESKKRLTDEEWQKSIKENKQPKQPEWTNSFIKNNKNVAPVPKELYESGC